MRLTTNRSFICTLICTGLWLATHSMASACTIQESTTQEKSESSQEEKKTEQKDNNSADSETRKDSEKTVAELEDEKKLADEFEAQQTKWEQLFAKLRQLSVMIRNTPSYKREAEARRLRKQVLDAAPTIAQATSAAARKYYQRLKSDPAADKKKIEDVEKVLLELAAFFVAGDFYDDANEISKVALSHDKPNPTFYDLAATINYSIHEFDAAKLMLDKANEFGSTRLSQNLSLMLEGQAELWEAETKIRAAEAAKNDLPRVKFETTAGTFVFELYENEAPGTVGNFVSLVEAGKYDGKDFHRVLANFMAQGGGQGPDGLGYTIYCECERDDARMHFRGTLSMAHAGKDTGGSQFFITFRPTPHLNKKHTAFGRVIEGMEFLPKIERVRPGQLDVKATVINKATVIRKRDHEYKPNKVEKE